MSTNELDPGFACLARVDADGKDHHHLKRGLISALRTCHLCREFLCFRCVHKQSDHFDAYDHGGAEDCSDEKIFGNILKKDKQSTGKAAQEGEGEKIACTRANLILSDPVQTIGLAQEFGI